MVKVFIVFFLMLSLSLSAQEKTGVIKVRKVKPDTVSYFAKGNPVINRSDFLACDSLETIMDFFVKNRDFRIESFQLNLLVDYNLSNFRSERNKITPAMRNAIAAFKEGRIFINAIKVRRPGDAVTGIEKVIFILNK